MAHTRNQLCWAHSLSVPCLRTNAQAGLRIVCALGCFDVLCNFTMGTTLPVPSLASTSDTLAVSSAAANGPVHRYLRAQMARPLINLNMEYQYAGALHLHLHHCAPLLCRRVQTSICRFTYFRNTLPGLRLIRNTFVDEFSMAVAYTQRFGPPHIFCTLTTGSVREPASARIKVGRTSADFVCIDLRLCIISGREYRATVSSCALIYHIKRVLADVMQAERQEMEVAWNHLHCLDGSGHELRCESTVTEANIKQGDVVQVFVDAEDYPALCDSDSDGGEFVLPADVICDIRTLHVNSASVS